MALPKAVGYTIVLLTVFICLGYRHSSNGLIEGLIGERHSHIHPRQQSEAAFNPYEHTIEAVVSVPDLELLRQMLIELPFPIMFNSTVEIISIEPTTVCTSNETGYQCRCEENFAWSLSSCIGRDLCDAIVGNTCGCINNLPAYGPYCQLNTSVPELLDIDLVLDLQIPIYNQTQINEALNILRVFEFPLSITETLHIIDLNLTTVCYPNPTGSLQCQCEEGFAWPCDRCNIYGPCNNTTNGNCGCIDGLLSFGEFCEPITNNSLCPNPAPELLDIDLVLDVQIPISNQTQVNEALNILRVIEFPLFITDILHIIDLNLTTVCYPNPAGSLQCQCEEGFAWPCDRCNIYGPCNNTTNGTCGCINGLPSFGEFCEPITNDAPCPTQTTVTTTMAMAPNTTTVAPNTTTKAPNTTMKAPNTTTKAPNTMETTIPTTIASEENLSITMDLPFNEIYNEPENEVHQNINSAIETQSKAFISTLLSAELIRFRSGSTIADYTIRANAFQENEINNLKTGLFRDLSQRYPIIFDSETNLKFVQPFLGQGTNLTCGPPPSGLNFSSSWTAEWTRNDELLLEDTQHSFSRDEDKATLIVSNFFFTDNGLYECRIRDKGVFRQRSNGPLTFKVIPLVHVSPLKIKVKCNVGKEVVLKCSVNSPYTVEFQDILSAGTGAEIEHRFTIPDDCSNQRFTCQVVNLTTYNKEITLELSTDESDCEDDLYGSGKFNDTVVASCNVDEVGERIVVCRENGTWEEIDNNCILQPIQELLDQSQFLNNNSLPEFLDQLSNVTLNLSQQVVISPANINAIVEILRNVANTTLVLNIAVTPPIMEDVLLTAGVLISNGGRESWDNLNSRSISVKRNTIPEAQSPSSSLLLSIETITTNLVNDSFDIVTDLIHLNKTRFTDTFNGDFNSTVEINIPDADGESKSLSVITFFSMDNVLPARDEDNSTSNIINGRVVLVQSSGTINNISFTFDVINNTLENPQCVFWNFSLFNDLGGWDDEGCELISNIDETVTCNCNHLTSFSILMSPFGPKDPVLDYITFIGVGISMASLVICLIIEAVIWRKIRRNTTSYLRHVSIVNIALSLLIANIWFIIGAAISDATLKNQPACSAATFFIHFFYLALFFWMLASALLLLYRTISVFDGGLSKSSMLAIGFTIGYGAPLIIATITIAVTAPKEQYIRVTGVCWLNWGESKALLAFVIPALTIVVVNFFILVTVIYKMLRRRALRDAAQAQERHVLVVIARSLAVLTPFFGLTWALGVGTMTNPGNRGIHISFAVFNSLQGFFILVFGTLLDKKVRSEIAIKSQTSSGGTRETSTGTTSGLDFFKRFRRGRDGYNVSSSESGASQAFVNT